MIQLFVKSLHKARHHVYLLVWLLDSYFNKHPRNILDFNFLFESVYLKRSTSAQIWAVLYQWLLISKTLKCNISALIISLRTPQTLPFMPHTKSSLQFTPPSVTSLKYY